MGDVINLIEKMRERKSSEEGPKLYVNHKTGIVTGKPSSTPDASTAEFGDRLQRIRASLQKINSLMAELKRMSKENDGT